MGPSEKATEEAQVLCVPPITKEQVTCLAIRWPKYWSFSFGISPSNEDSGLISFRIDWFDLFAVQGLSRVFSNTTVPEHPFFSTQTFLWLNFHNCTGSWKNQPYL